jgi:hypothetical protein
MLNERGKTYTNIFSSIIDTSYVHFNIYSVHTWRKKSKLLLLQTLYNTMNRKQNNIYNRWKYLDIIHSKQPAAYI